MEFLYNSSISKKNGILKPLLDINQMNPEYHTFEKQFIKKHSYFKSRLIPITRIKLTSENKTYNIFNKENIKIKKNSNFQIKIFVETNLSLENFIIDCYSTNEKEKMEEFTFIVKDKHEQLDFEKKINLPMMTLNSKILKFLFILRKGSEFSKFEFTLKIE